MCVSLQPAVPEPFILLSSTPAFTVAQAPYQVIPPPPNGDNGCCYGRLSFSNGQTVTSLPECCVSLVCVDGIIEPRHFSKPGTSGCRLSFCSATCIRDAIYYWVSLSVTYLIVLLNWQVVSSTDRCTLTELNSLRIAFRLCVAEGTGLTLTR